MAAYAALLALARSLRDILDLQQYVDPLHKEKILSLHEKVDFIVTFLEDHSDKHQDTLGRMRIEIRKAAYEAQDFMDSYYCSVSRFTDADGEEVNLDRDLTMAFGRIGFIWDELMKMKNSDVAQDLQSVSYSSAVDHSSMVQATAKKLVVGFDDDLIAIKERLYEDADELQIIPIVGMGGIGKTTLARRVYDDSLLTQHFDISAWITVSAEYQRGQILSGLLHNLEKRDREQYHRMGDAQLVTLVYQKLKDRRYLIVVDDIWSAKPWDDLKMIFPDDGNGSRILLTTRILDVTAHLRSSDTPVHQMKCLNEDQSWKLLQERVFGQQSCPLQLVEVGKKIAKYCGGLPLTIVVVAGLLLSSGDVMREQVWENVSENISSRDPTIALQCSKILCFSYDRLPLRLKPCFLYIAAFPEDSEIEVSKLIKLWVAEGFLKLNDQSKCLEDVGERYLVDLVKRSLLLVIKKGHDQKLETVGIHDMLRDICITKAEEEGFLHHVSSKPYRKTEFVENPYRRLKIHCTEYFQEWHILYSSTRSVLLFSNRFQEPILYIRSRHVSILDVPEVHWRNLSHVAYTFFNLRYFAFTLDSASFPLGFPVSITKHPNLETIFVRQTDDQPHSQRQVPYEILKMPKLRHLIWDTSFRLCHPSDDIEIVHESDLQTIESVIDFVFTEKTIKMLVNMKKLKVKYIMRNHNWDDFKLDNLSHFQNLEDLHMSMVTPLFDHLFVWNNAFPIGLKKLNLYGVPLPWENMTIIGSLPNLQVLSMMNITVNKFSEWTTMEGQFLQLKYFRSSLNLVVKWETEKEHFPCLESLILEDARYLDEIPRGIGEVDSLQYIELHDCEKSLVNSAKQIEKQQHENGNDAFRVHII